MRRREAAVWLARLQSRRDPEIERKFHRWRDADSRNAEAFERVRRSYEQAGLLRYSSAWTGGHRQEAARRPERQRGSLVALAAMGAIVSLPLAILAFRSADWFSGEKMSAVMLTTSAGEIKKYKLKDGSELTLDTATRVDLDLQRSKRHARLNHGRARFRIAKDGVPFVITTNRTVITTHQGLIDIDQGARRDSVQVLAGMAQVRGSAQSQGNAVTAQKGDDLKIESGRVERSASETTPSDWTSGMLEFEETPLAEAIATANRYSGRHILLEGSAKGARVTGAFRAGDTQGLAKALAVAFKLKLRAREDGALVLSSTH